MGPYFEGGLQYGITMDLVPRGSKYPIFKDSGPKSHLGYGFWDQNP